MRFQLLLLASCIIFMGCSSSEESNREASDPINYETLQGGWRIIEIHANNAELNELQSHASDESSSVFASLIFYRPTLGDPARLSMSWNCNGLGFSYKYENNLFTRIGGIGGHFGPWSSNFLPKLENLNVQPRSSCIGLSPDERPEGEKIAVLMSLLAKRLILFETYEVDLQMEGDIVSIFTSDGDGIYGERLWF